MASATFTEALGQLIYTLRAAPDRIDEISLLCTQRFIEVYGRDAGDISTAAAGDAQTITQLTLRAYAQAPGREERSPSSTSSTGYCLSMQSGPRRQWTKQSANVNGLV